MPTTAPRCTASRSVRGVDGVSLELNENEIYGLAN